MNTRGSLPPLKLAALLSLVRGPLTFIPDVGWRSEYTRQVFNSHTAWYVRFRGWAQLSKDGAQLLPTKAALEAAAALTEAA